MTDSKSRWEIPPHYNIVRRQISKIGQGKRPGSDFVILDDDPNNHLEVNPKAPLAQSSWKDQYKDHTREIVMQRSNESVFDQRRPDLRSGLGGLPDVDWVTDFRV